MAFEAGTQSTIGSRYSTGEPTNRPDTREPLPAVATHVHFTSLILQLQLLPT